MARTAVIPAKNAEPTAKQSHICHPFSFSLYQPAVFIRLLLPSKGTAGRSESLRHAKEQLRSCSCPFFLPCFSASCQTLPFSVLSRQPAEFQRTGV
ncbi:hypothetical protein CLOM621_06528 [Clostridium sp. M62/1]|nr:hypothetical protein CLOM621_06528 [Clostridium sp. M62/1]